jgi:hypothetical protein
MPIYFSTRGNPLAFTGRPGPRPVLTVELEEKWYSLFLVKSDCTVEEIPFPDCMDYATHGSPYVDHAPSPFHVAQWAKDKDIHLDDVSLELIIGRWELESGVDHYRKLNWP